MRRTPFKRSPSRAKKEGIAKPGLPSGVRAQLETRSQGRCEIVHPGCTEEAAQAHHRLPRSAGGPHVLENLLHLCGPGHRWVHRHPGLAYEDGTLVRRGADPALKPCWVMKPEARAPFKRERR